MKRVLLAIVTSMILALGLMASSSGIAQARPAEEKQWFHNGKCVGNLQFSGEARAVGSHETGYDDVYNPGLNYITRTGCYPNRTEHVMYTLYQYRRDFSTGNWVQDGVNVLAHWNLAPGQYGAAPVTFTLAAGKHTYVWYQFKWYANGNWIGTRWVHFNAANDYRCVAGACKVYINSQVGAYLNFLA